MKLLTFIFSLVLLSGCTSISNISKEREFSRFVNNKVVLKKQVLVCKDEPLRTGKGDFLENELVYVINASSIGECSFGKTIGIFPVGTELEIEEVEKHSISGVKSVVKIYFFGTSSLSNRERIQFYYLYGFEGYYDNQPW